MTLAPPDGASVCAGAGCGGCCMTLWVPFLVDFLHRQHIHTHMHRMIRSRRIPPPTPPPIAAATDEVGSVEVKPMETGRRHSHFLSCQMKSNSSEWQWHLL